MSPRGTHTSTELWLNMKCSPEFNQQFQVCFVQQLQKGSSAQMWLFGARSTGSHGSVHLSGFLNCGVWVQMALARRNSDTFFFLWPQAIKCVSAALQAGLAVEDTESQRRSWACGCSISSVVEVKMSWTWLFKQVPFWLQLVNNDLCWLAVMYNVFWVMWN